MNLIGNPWIPVLFNSGDTKLVSLKELYEQSENISDLVLNPPQRISVMRLLICITQAALDGPEDETDWKDCKNRIVDESIKYLEERKDKFELFGDKPFLQIKDLEAEKHAVIDLLDFSKASGNNTVLFDHNAVPEGRDNKNWQKALALLTSLNFSTTGKVGQAKWQNNTFNESTYAAPCIKKSHTFIFGKTILETIFLNLLPKSIIKTLPNSNFGQPVWDNFPKSPNDVSAFENASKTYLGRLVPLSRFIKLDNNPEITKCIFGPTCKELKFEYLPAFLEPTCTVLKSKKNELFYMRISSDKHIWRDFGAVFSLDQTGTQTLKNVKKIVCKKENINIWIGGLETGAQAAKIKDTVEWNFFIPVSQLGETELNKYKEGIGFANNAEFSLKNAVKTFCKELKMESSLNSKAVPFFWQQLDNKYELLLKIANDVTKPMDEWEKLLYKTMLWAYEFACPKETPRQIQAYVLGKKYLTIKKK